MARYFYKIGNGRAVLWGATRTKSVATHELTETFLSGLKKGDELWGVSVIPKASKNLRLWARRRGIRLEEVTRKAFPQRSRYASSLGLDRLVNVYAAFMWLRKSAIVLDFGTALTVDFIDDRGIHQGGFIVGSPDLNLKALHQATALLPLIASKRSLHLRWARTTSAALREGQILVVRGLINEFKRLVYEKFSSRPWVIITGGGAPRQKGAAVKCEPELTLRGLRAWAASR